MGLGNIQAGHIFGAVIGIVVLLLSHARKIARFALLASIECVFSKKLAGSVKLWLLLIMILFGFLVHVPSVQGRLPVIGVDTAYIPIPTITISSPSNGDILTTESVTVSGTATDYIGLSRVEVSVNSEAGSLRPEQIPGAFP